MYRSFSFFHFNLPWDSLHLLSSRPPPRWSPPLSPIMANALCVPPGRYVASITSWSNLVCFPNDATRHVPNLSDSFLQMTTTKQDPKDFLPRDDIVGDDQAYNHQLEAACKGLEEKYKALEEDYMALLFAGVHDKELSGSSVGRQLQVCSSANLVTRPYACPRRSNHSTCFSATLLGKINWNSFWLLIFAECTYQFQWSIPPQWRLSFCFSMLPCWT